MLGRTPSKKRRNSGMYGYPRDLTQELARLRQLKANATANPAEPELAGFGSFEYVDLGTETGSELETATTLKTLTTTISSDQGTFSNKAKLAAAILKMGGISYTRQQAAGGAGYERAIELFKAALPKVPLDYVGAQTEARGGLIAYIDARKSAPTTPAAGYKDWTVDQIKTIQRALARIGYYARAIDGIIGSGTTTALDKLVGVGVWESYTPAQVVWAANALPVAQGGGGSTPKTEPLIVPKTFGSTSKKGLIIGLVAAGAVAVGVIAYVKSRGRKTTVTYQPARG